MLTVSTFNLLFEKRECTIPSKEKLKKIFQSNLSFFLLVTSIFVISIGVRAEEKKLSLKFTGGISNLLLTDLNEYIKDASRYPLDRLKSAGYVANHEFENFHSARDLEILIMISVSKRVSLDIGSGYIYSKKPRNQLVMESSFSTITSVLNHTIKAIPVTLGIHFEIPLSTNSRFCLFSGFGLYFSKFLETGEEQLDLKTGKKGYSHSWKADSKATGLGGFVGWGYEFDILKELTLLLEANARYAKISGFSGISHDKFNNAEWEDDLELRYYEFYNSYLDDTYKALNLPNAERGFELSVLRDAVIDLSGFSVKVGFKINF